MASPRFAFSPALVLVIVSSLAVAACSPNDEAADDGLGDDVGVVERPVSSAVLDGQENTSSSAYPSVTDVSRAMASSSSSRASNPVAIIPVPTASGASESSAPGRVTGSMVISEEPDRGEAQPGERVWYTIVVSNETNASMENLVVENAMPAGKMTVIDPSGGIVSGDRITWNIDSLAPGQSRLLRFQGQIAMSAAHGESVLNIATLRGGRLPVTVTATSEVKVIKKLPQTGPSDFSKPLEDTGRYLRPYRN